MKLARDLQREFMNGALKSQILRVSIWNALSQKERGIPYLIPYKTSQSVRKCMAIEL